MGQKAVGSLQSKAPPKPFLRPTPDIPPKREDLQDMIRVAESRVMYGGECKVPNARACIIRLLAEASASYDAAASKPAKGQWQWKYTVTWIREGPQTSK